MSRASSGSAPQAPEHRLSSLCGQRAFCPLNGKGEVLHQLGEVFAPPHFRQAKSLPTAQAGKPVFRALAHLRAFTLVEVLVAMTFLGILVPVIVSALSVATRASVSAERTTLAAQLAENKLSELLLDKAWSSGENRGDFGEEHPGYRWELQSVGWQTASEMTELTLQVFFEVQGRERVVELSTLDSSQ